MWAIYSRKGDGRSKRYYSAWLLPSEAKALQTSLNLPKLEELASSYDLAPLTPDLPTRVLTIASPWSSKEAVIAVRGPILQSERDPQIVTVRAPPGDFVHAYSQLFQRSIGFAKGRNDKSGAAEPLGCDSACTESHWSADQTRSISPSLTRRAGGLVAASWPRSEAQSAQLPRCAYLGAGRAGLGRNGVAGLEELRGVPRALYGLPEAAAPTGAAGRPASWLLLPEAEVAALDRNAALGRASARMDVRLSREALSAGCRGLQWPA